MAIWFLSLWTPNFDTIPLLLGLSNVLASSTYSEFRQSRDLNDHTCSFGWSWFPIWATFNRRYFDLLRPYYSYLTQRTNRASDTQGAMQINFILVVSLVCQGVLGVFRRFEDICIENSMRNRAINNSMNKLLFGFLGRLKSQHVFLR